MTRGVSTMAETRWSNFTGTPADTNDVETISTAPPISSYRAMYHHAPPPVGSTNQGTSDVSPDHHLITPNPTMMPASTVFDAADPYGFSMSDWSPKHCAVDVARVQIKPNASVTSSDSDIFKRSVNERLDKYMVIRQRTFHGLVRSKSALRRLPLTDPRETMSEGSTPTWLHRSKTDLYIEKWRSKSNAKNRERSKSGSSAIDLTGMTLGSLCDSLPKSRLEKALSLPSSTSRRVNKTMPKPLVPNPASNGSETRFPPLPSTSIKHTLPEPNGKTTNLLHDRVFEQDVDAAHSPPPSPTKGVWSARQKKSPTSGVLVLPSQREGNNVDSCEAPKGDVNQTAYEKGLPRRVGGGGEEGKEESHTQVSKNSSNQSKSSPESPRRSKEKWMKQKKEVAAIPLQIWEPSFESLVPSNPKLVSPRHHHSRAWPGNTLRQVLK